MSTACTSLVSITAICVVALCQACSPFSGADSQTDAGASSNQNDAGPADEAGTDGAAPIGPYEAAVLADHPILYLRMEEAPGSTTVISDGLPKKVGAVFGSPELGIPGKVGFAVQFGVLGQRIEIDDGAFDFQGTSPFTIESWTRVDATDGQSRHLFTRDTTNQSTMRQEYGLLVRANLFLFERFVDGTSRTITTATPTDKQWHHVVGTYDGTLLRLYLDGVNAAMMNDARDAGAKTLPLVVGAKSASDGPYTGAMDEVAVYATALPATRIAAHYAAAGKP